MKKEDIRRENLFTVMSFEDGTVTSVANRSGISRTTLSGVANGKPMLTKHARMLETAYEKPFGWFDKKHVDDEIAPLFDVAVLRRAMAFIYENDQIHEKYDELSVEGRADYLAKYYILFNDPEVNKLSHATLLNLIGVNDGTNENKGSRKSKKSTR